MVSSGFGSSVSKHNVPALISPNDVNLKTCVGSVPRAEDVGGDVAIPALGLTDADRAKDAEARKRAAADEKSAANAAGLQTGATKLNAEHAKAGDEIHLGTPNTEGAANAILGSAQVDDSSVPTGKAAVTPVSIDTGTGKVTSGQIRVAESTIKTYTLEQLVQVYKHEGDHWALNAAIDKIKSPDPQKLERKEHDIICGKKKNCDPLCEGENCGSCSPAIKEQEAALKCSTPKQGLPAVDPLAPLIYPDDSSGSKGAWSGCFAGLTSGSLPPSVPPICASLKCSPLDAVSLDLSDCHCTTQGAGLPRYTPSRCGTLLCQDGMPVLGPTGFCGRSTGNFNIHAGTSAVAAATSDPVLAASAAPRHELQPKTGRPGCQFGEKVNSAARNSSHVLTGAS